MSYNMEKKSHCKVEIFESSDKGRGLKAQVQFNPGFVVLTSEPFVYLLSKKKKGLHCDYCFKKQVSLLQCSGCKYMKYCNHGCQKSAWLGHHKQECAALKKAAPKRPPDLVILLARILWNLQRSYSLNDESPDIASLCELESNYNKLTEEQKEILGRYMVILRTYWGQSKLPPQVPDYRALLELFARIKNNSFAICDEELQSDVGTGVYLTCSLINHSCEPNCVAEFNNLTLNIRAIRKIKAGEEILISYVDLFAPSSERQEELLNIYRFSCNCNACTTKLNDEMMLQDFSGQISKSKQSSVKDLLTQLDELRKVHEYSQMKQLTVGFVDRKVLPMENIYMAKILDFAMDACIELQEFEQAFYFGSLALQSYKVYLHENHPMTGLQMMKLGKILLFKEKNVESMGFLTQACKILQITHSSQGTVLVELETLLAQCSMEMQQEPLKGRPRILDSS